MAYRIKLRSVAQKHAKIVCKDKKLKSKVDKILKIIIENPYQYPPEFEYLKGEAKGYISRRLDIKNRLVYNVDENEKIIYVVSMLTHYEDMRK